MNNLFDSVSESYQKSMEIQNKFTGSLQPLLDSQKKWQIISDSVKTNISKIEISSLSVET